MKKILNLQWKISQKDDAYTASAIEKGAHFAIYEIRIGSTWKSKIACSVNWTLATDAYARINELHQLK